MLQIVYSQHLYFALSRKPWTRLVHLYLKTENCIRLKRLMWWEPLFILKICELKSSVILRFEPMILLGLYGAWKLSFREKGPKSIADLSLTKNYVFSLNEYERVKSCTPSVLPYEAAWLWKNQERRWFLVQRGMASLSGLQRKPEYQLLGKDDSHTHAVQCWFLRSDLEKN